MEKNKLESWPVLPTIYTGGKENNGCNKYLSVESLSLLRHLIWILEYCLARKRESSEKKYDWLIESDKEINQLLINKQIELNAGIYHWVILPILHKLIEEDIEIGIFEDIESIRKTGRYDGHPSLKDYYADDHS